MVKLFTDMIKKALEFLEGRIGPHVLDNFSKHDLDQEL